MKKPGLRFRKNSTRLRALARETSHHPIAPALGSKAGKILRSSRMPRGNGKLAISRRTLLVGGAALSVLPSRRAFSQASEPLKVGFLTVNTGPLAAEDTAGNPALAR